MGDRPPKPLADLGGEVLWRFSEKKMQDRQKVYFQCLLALRQCFNRGLTCFSHSEPVSYYTLMMHNDSLASHQPGRPAKEYQAALKALMAGGTIAIAGVDDEVGVGATEDGIVDGVGSPAGCAFPPGRRQASGGQGRPHSC